MTPCITAWNLRQALRRLPSRLHDWKKDYTLQPDQILASWLPLHMASQRDQTWLREGIQHVGPGI